MYFSFLGKELISATDFLRFAATTSCGVWANQSDSRNVKFSEKSGSLNTRRNSTPSSRAWIECGRPASKFHRSPALTSSMYDRPNSSMEVTRQLPTSTRPHSASLCQWSSR